MHDLPFTLSALRAAYRKGAKPEAVIEEVYRRIAQVNDPGIFIHLLDKSEVLEAVKSLGTYDPEKPLWGIPFAIKDNMDLAGKPTTAACPAFEYQADQDAFVVNRLKDAGALVIGKTNLDQFATGLAGLRSPYPPPKNAVDPQIVPGGSSSGSAVVVGHGIVCFALGTDTAGSGRVPAALNNIVGLKPTLGTISASGVVPACRTLDTVSVLALTVGDAYAIYEVATAFDSADAYSRNISVKPLSSPPSNLKISVPDEASLEFFGDEFQVESFANTLALLEKDGAKITPVDFTPFYDVATMLYGGPWLAERYTLIEDLLRDQPEVVHPVTTQAIGAASEMTAGDVFKGFYRLKELSRKTEPVLADCDLLCVPSIPTFFSVADVEADPIDLAAKLGVYAIFVNMLDLCGLAVPVAPRKDTRPGGVTLLANAGEDALLSSVGMRLEQLAPHRLGATGWSSESL